MPSPSSLDHPSSAHAAAAHNSRSKPTRPSVAIVGAGPGGLATAVLLLASGADVTIYERTDRVGGRTSRLSLQGASGNYHFDLGPTFFLMPYVLGEIFASAGKRMEDYVELTRLDPMYRLIFGKQLGPDGTPLKLDCTQDPAEMGRRVGAIEPQDGAAFEGFIRANRAKLAAFEPVLRRAFRSPLDLLAPEMLKALPHLAPTQSVADWLGSRFRNEHVRMALCFQTKYLGMSPFKCPSLFTILPFIEYQWGVWHPTGGCNAITSGLARLISELGGVIKTLSPVQHLNFDKRRVTGVQVADQHHPHDHVVINADAAWALKNLIPSRLRGGLGGAQSDARLDAMDYSCSTSMLYLGVKGRVKLPHHTIYISADYQTNIRQVAETGELSSDPSVYVCNPTTVDPALAPPGNSALYVLVPTPNLKQAAAAGTDLAAGAAQLRNDAIARVSALAGEDLAPRIECERAINPNDWKAMNIQFGATFNLAHGLDQMLFLRPRAQLPGVRNVWLTGGGTHPGSGLPVIFLSSQIAARLLCERAGLHYAGKATPIASVLDPSTTAPVANPRTVSTVDV